MYRMLTEEEKLLRRMLSLNDGDEMPDRVVKKFQQFKHCQQMSNGHGAGPLSRDVLLSVAVTSGCVSLPEPFESKFADSKAGDTIYWTRGGGDEIDVQFVRLTSADGVVRIRVYGNERELSESVLSLESKAAKTPVKAAAPTSGKKTPVAASS